MTKEELIKEGFAVVEPMAQGDAWDFTQNPTARGVYMGMQVDVGANQSTMYHFIDERGDAFSVWGSRLLDDRFKGIEIGETVVIMYKGMQKAKNSNREYKAYDVLHKMVPGEKERLMTAGEGNDGDKTVEVGEDIPF